MVQTDRDESCPSNRMVDTRTVTNIVCECGQVLPTFGVQRHLELTGHKIRG